MTFFLVATADNITTDIDLSPLCKTEEEASSILQAEYQSAKERFFGNAEVKENDEDNLSDTGFSVYHSGSQDFTSGRILEIEIPNNLLLSRKALDGDHHNLCGKEGQFNG